MRKEEAKKGEEVGDELKHAQASPPSTPSPSFAVRGANVLLRYYSSHANRQVLMLPALGGDRKSSPSAFILATKSKSKSSFISCHCATINPYRVETHPMYTPPNTCLQLFPRLRLPSFSSVHLFFLFTCSCSDEIYLDLR